jgi:hypothetical protein
MSSFGARREILLKGVEDKRYIGVGGSYPLWIKKDGVATFYNLVTQKKQ